VATFLTTPAMPSALRARIERAVSPRARARHHAGRAGLERTFASGGGKLRFMTLFPLLVAAGLGGLGVASYRAERRAVTSERGEIAAALAARRAELPTGHENFLDVTNRWITDAASDQADAVAPQLQGKAALDGWLGRPAVYVHLSAAGVGDARALDDAARGSGKDAFLFCLLRPPPSGSERDLLAKVRGTYFAGAKVDDETANVRRLADAHVGLSAVGPSFESAVALAEGLPALTKLHQALTKAPLAAAAKAASAELFIVVVDQGPAARVLLVDLPSKSVLLRLHRRLEAGGTSPAAVLHREHLQGCGLALATRNAAEGWAL
jgi:hypothetical protein